MNNWYIPTSSPAITTDRCIHSAVTVQHLQWFSIHTKNNKRQKRGRELTCTHAYFGFLSDLVETHGPMRRSTINTHTPGHTYQEPRISTPLSSGLADVPSEIQSREEAESVLRLHAVPEERDGYTVYTSTCTLQGPMTPGARMSPVDHNVLRRTPFPLLKNTNDRRRSERARAALGTLSMGLLCLSRISVQPTCPPSRVNNLIRTHCVIF